MKTRKTVSRPLCKRSKLFESLIGKDDSEIDPNYKLFLENLTIDGDTYALNVANGDHGMPVSMRYEEDMSCSNVMDKNATDFPNSSLHKSWGAPKAKQKGNLCHMKTHKTVNGPPCKKSKLFESLSCKGDSEIDPSYKLFLEKLTIDGDTYVLNVPNGDHGMPVSVRYEEDMSCGNVIGKNARVFPNSSLDISRGAPMSKQKGEASGRTSSVKKDMKPLAMDESYELFLSHVKLKDGFMVIEPEPGVTIVYEQEEDLPARYDELRVGNSTNGPKTLISPTESMKDIAMCASEGGLAQADKIASEDEMAGPSSRTPDWQDIFCTGERGDIPHTESSDLNECKYDTGAQLALICSSSSTFDEKLNAVLNQPYDQNEYEELWKKATDRKPVSRQRHLRSASKRYVTKAIGLSYLDHYPDLAVQIDSADSYERLSLLRKFFFWLENLCHEGAYMPWISRPLACDPILPDGV